MAITVRFVEDVSGLDLTLAYADLMVAAFGGSHTPWIHAYRPKHEENPFGGSYAALAFDAGRLVAMDFFWKGQFSLPTTVVRAAQSCDLAVHPDYQGKGLFSKLHKAAMNEIPDGVIRYAFPNADSFPGFQKFGWTPRDEYRKYLFVVNIGRFIRQRVLRRNQDFRPSARETGVEASVDALNDFFRDIKRRPDAWITDYTADVIGWRLRLSETLRVETVFDDSRIVALLIYSLSGLAIDPTYRLLSIIDMVFDPSGSGIPAVRKRLHSLVERYDVSEIQTATTQPFGLLASEGWRVHSKPSLFIVDPSKGWSHGISMETFMAKSRLTAFNSDHV